MAPRYVLGMKRVFPEVERTLGLRALQALAFAQARDIEHFTGRALNSLDDIIGPRQTPTGFGKRVDPRHAFPAAVAVAHALRLRLVH